MRGSVTPQKSDRTVGPYLAGSEFSIEELLAEPTTQALMRADGVVASDVFAIINNLRPQERRAHAQAAT